MCVNPLFPADASASHIAAAYQHKCATLFGHTSAAHIYRDTAYSRAIDARKIVGDPSCRLVSLPEEPVIAAASELWNHEKGR